VGKGFDGSREKNEAVSWENKVSHKPIHEHDERKIRGEKREKGKTQPSPSPGIREKVEEELTPRTNESTKTVEIANGSGRGLKGEGKNKREKEKENGKAPFGVTIRGIQWDFHTILNKYES